MRVSKVKKFLSQRVAEIVHIVPDVTWEDGRTFVEGKTERGVESLINKDECLGS